MFVRARVKKVVRGNSHAAVMITYSTGHNFRPRHTYFSRFAGNAAANEWLLLRLKIDRNFFFFRVHS